MTLIHLQFSRPGADGVLVPATGTLTFTPTLRHNSGSTVVLPVGFSVTVGTGTSSVVLAPTGLDWAWKVVEEFPGLSRRTIYVTVPDVPNFEYADLVQVDRATLAPTATPDPAWWAVAGAAFTGASLAGGDLVLSRKDGTSVNVGTVSGAPGLPGKDGRDGIDGINGTNGHDGIDGADGRDGVDGHNPITVGTTAPPAPAENDIWFDIS